MSLKMTIHVIVVPRCTGACLWCKSTENWTTGSHSTRAPSTGSQDSSRTWMIPSGPGSSSCLPAPSIWVGGALVSCSLPHWGHMGCHCYIPGGRPSVCYIPGRRQTSIHIDLKLCHVNLTYNESGKVKGFSWVHFCPK